MLTDCNALDGGCHRRGAKSGAHLRKQRRQQALPAQDAEDARARVEAHQRARDYAGQRALPPTGYLAQGRPVRCVQKYTVHFCNMAETVASLMAGADAVAYGMQGQRRVPQRPRGVVATSSLCQVL